MKIPSPRKILVVDDDPNFRWSLCETLSLDGFDVVEAENGTKGFECFCETEVDAVISDLSMADGNGVGLLDRIRVSTRKDIPVFLITGNFEIDEEALLKRGATGIMHKPFLVSKIVAKLNYSFSEIA